MTFLVSSIAGLCLGILPVIWLYRTGIPWRDLPERFGNYMIDATIVRAHQHSDSAKHSIAEQEDIGRSKLGGIYLVASAILLA